MFNATIRWKVPANSSNGRPHLGLVDLPGWSTSSNPGPGHPRSCRKTSSASTGCRRTSRCTGTPPPESSGVPTAFLQFAHDIGIRPFVESEHRVERRTDIDHGGHFAAMEEPGILVEDLRTFFRDLR